MRYDSKEDFIHYIINHYYRIRGTIILFRIFRINIDLETAQRLADSIFSRLEKKKKMIKKVDSKSLTDYYTFNRGKTSVI